MVYYFVSRDPWNYVIYMGKNELENDRLVEYGWPDDIWFHVDDLPSAHVYLRLPKGQTIDDCPPELIEECSHLCKNNSTKGSKLTNVKIMYTSWNNLYKPNGTSPGAVSYHNSDEIRYFTVKPKRVNAILNRLNRTKTERVNPDLATEQQQRFREDHLENKRRRREEIAREKEEARLRKLERDQKHYVDFFDEDEMVSNAEIGSDYEDNFM
eukprot:TRINITY_DN7630_c0_g1_i1.p1 TRINITY_DN7630_c0_g1~~TRINITY_DN7630_c0_g1_i1.p1  ORF type:complete len:211 (-),score=45.49 TRINITY_DN7630_c0_g1_i1:23-655(-)